MTERYPIYNSDPKEWAEPDPDAGLVPDDPPPPYKPIDDASDDDDVTGD